MIIDPTSVAFDIDGVVADTMNLFLDIARNDYHIDHISYDDFTCYELLECIDLDPEVMSNIIARLIDGRYTEVLEPFEGAAAVLQRLGRHCRSLLFVTARPHPGPITGWLEQTIDIDPGVLEIVATGSYDSKASVLKEKNISYFIEDRLETCFQLQVEGITPVVFRQPWNRQAHPFREVGSWEELEALFQY